MNKRHYEHTLPNIRGSLSNTYSHTGIGICRCYQCRMKKKNCSTSGRKSLKRAINKFRRKQLKLDKVTRHNHFGGYWA